MDDETGFQRGQFTFFASYADSIQRIKKPADRAKAYDTLVNYALRGIEPDLDSLPEPVALIFPLIKPVIDASRRKAEAGKRGGSKSEAKRKQSGSKREADDKQSESKTQADSKQTQSKVEANAKQNASKVEANRKQNGSNKDMDKDMDMDKDKEKENKKENSACVFVSEVSESGEATAKQNESNVEANAKQSASKRKAKAFTPPTVEEVAAFCQKRKNGIDPEEFVASYDAKGWKIGNTTMVSWQSCVITWEKRRKRNGHGNYANGGDYTPMCEAIGSNGQFDGAYASPDEQWGIRSAF